MSYYYYYNPKQGGSATGSDTSDILGFTSVATYNRRKKKKDRKREIIEQALRAKIIAPETIEGLDDDEIILILVQFI